MFVALEELRWDALSLLQLVQMGCADVFLRLGSSAYMSASLDCRSIARDAWVSVFVYIVLRISKVAPGSAVRGRLPLPRGRRPCTLEKIVKRMSLFRDNYRP